MIIHLGQANNHKILKFIIVRTMKRNKYMARQQIRGPCPSQQKKGKQSLDESSDSFELKSRYESENISSGSEQFYSELDLSDSDLSDDNLSDSDSDNDDQQIKAKAREAVEFPARLMEMHFGQMKNEYAKKVELIRNIKIEVKEELADVNDENAGLQHQVGFNEGKAEILARENEVAQGRGPAGDPVPFSEVRELEQQILEPETRTLGTLNSRQNPRICKMELKRKLAQTLDSVDSMKIRIENRLLKCDFCGKGFRQKSTLTAHVRTHTGDRPFKCDRCDKAFVQKMQLQSHQRIHTGERPFKCGDCNKEFVQQNQLITHRRTHTGERPFKCECGRAFTTQTILKNHRRIHTGELPYKCEICGEKFIQKNHLDNHNKIHTGERQYKCEFCEKVFIRKDYLHFHIKTEHAGERRHKCSHCQKVFDRKDRLKKHINKRHMENEEVDI